MFTDQTRAPILEALQDFVAQGATSFGVPGHKSGKGAPDDIKQAIGAQAFMADATTQKGIDDRRETQGTLEKAEHLAALAWGADRCYLSTNGTSLSNHVAFLCSAQPGDTVLVAPNSHKSVISGLILSGLRPVFLQPDRDADWDIEHGIPVSELERQLQAHPEAKGVFIVSPNYFGVVPDVRRLADICHRHGKPLLVDEAWGPHFAFHPELPPSAISCGADMAMGSIHKMLAGLQGASILLLRSNIIPADRFALCYDLFESTSPPVQVLASIDATRRQFALHGGALLGDVLRRVRLARAGLAAIPGLRVMGPEVLDGDARFALDETKLLIDISELGVTGYAAEDWLIAEHNLSMGLSDDRHLLAVFTIGNDDADTDALVSAMRGLADWAATHGRADSRPADMPRRQELGIDMAMSPSEAFFGPTERVAIDDAAGRIAAEMVAPYPPGIPRLLPGQRITDTHVLFLQRGRQAGFLAMGVSDRRLDSLRVVAAGA